MAKINVQFDTNTKEMKGDIDGKAIDNLKGVEIHPSYTDEDKHTIRMHVHKHDEENDLHHHHHIVASESDEAKSEEATPSNVYVGFVIVPRASSVIKSIATLFNRE